MQQHASELENQIRDGSVCGNVTGTRDHNDYNFLNKCGKI